MALCDLVGDRRGDFWVKFIHKQVPALYPWHAIKHVLNCVKYLINMTQLIGKKWVLRAFFFLFLNQTLHLTGSTDTFSKCMHNFKWIRYLLRWYALYQTFKRTINDIKNNFVFLRSFSYLTSGSPVDSWYPIDSDNRKWWKVWCNWKDSSVDNNVLSNV